MEGSIRKPDRYSDDGRVCMSCGKYKKWAEFYADKRSPNARGSRCKVCRNAYNKEHYINKYVHKPRFAWDANGRVCSGCKQYFPWNAFHLAKNGINGHAGRCKSCKAQGKQKIKQETFDHYGGSCACCGERALVFLTIDHVFGDGQEHRHQTRGGGTGTYLWLRRNNYPSGFQVLCFNCNVAKKFGGGICEPHGNVLGFDGKRGTQLSFSPRYEDRYKHKRNVA